MKTYPNAPQCSNWPQMKPRCAHPASVHLIAADGIRVPGGPFCSDCANATIAEYATGLGEQWASSEIVIAS